MTKQWKKRLLENTDINYEAVRVSKRKTALIGDLVSGQNKLTGKIDVALMQSMFEKDKSVKNILDNYGLIIVLHGELSAKDRRKVLDSINNLDKDHPILIISIGKLVGEGFDLPYLDTLVLASPISWKGRIIQYAGRLHRACAGKTELRIIDYVDIHFSMLERMYFKRLKVYKSMGYSLQINNQNLDFKDKLFFDESYRTLLIEDIKSTKNSIVISIPYLTKKNFEYFKTEIFAAYSRGIRVVVLFKMNIEYGEKYIGFMKKVQEQLENIGIEVINKENNEYQFIIIDDKIIWLGELKSVVMRIYSDELANELNSIIVDKKRNSNKIN